VIARESAYTYKGKPEDVRKIGEELGVRYVLEGSVRRIESTLRINVQLTSGETGAHLWSDRFDEQIAELAAGQEQIAARMRDGLGISMVEIENARSLRERPTNPDAFDLILRARSLQHLPQNPQRDKEVLALYERALLLDPSSVPALVGVAYLLIDRRPGNWGNFEDMQRAERLLTQARAIAPESAEVLDITLYWLRSVGRCQEVIEAAEQALKSDPNRMAAMTGVYNELGVCKTVTGHAEEEIALQARADQLNPRSPWKFSRYRHMGFASLVLGRDKDAIMFLQRSLAMNPEPGGSPWTYRMLAAAYARTGQMEEARRFLSEADRLWPYDTVRSQSPLDPSNTVHAEEIRHFQAALHLAGERDHADEDADFGVRTDGTLHSEFVGFTPTDAPGVRTIRTADFAQFLAEARPVVIDTVTYSRGRSIPGAVGLKFAGLGGSFTDAAQDHLRNIMRELTTGDLSRPIVAVGWNSERFDGRNLALRLAALGYTQVYWYRGGREAWEVNGLPETMLDVQEW
jgi:tetratricopeptide (TPR) repeat protein